MSRRRIASPIGWLFVSCIAVTSSAAAESHCRSVSFSGQIHAGEKFSKEIGGGLVLVLAPQKFANGPDTSSSQLSGWGIGLYLASAKTPHDAAQDFIWPVNPPFHFNPIQDIGTSYGITAIEKLKHSILYNFVLDWADYDKIGHLASDAIWPYEAKDPDHAGENYLAALNALQLGQIRFSPIRYVTTEKGMSILKLEFRVEIAAPSTFPFAASLDPTPSACPTRKT
jgi:hypothetical protein